MSDIENFLRNPVHRKGILLFPPISKYRRFLIHKLIEESFSHNNLQTLSVGKDSGRRTAVFLRVLLRPGFTVPATVSTQSRRQRAFSPLTPMVNKNGDSNKSRTPYGGVYRPPAVRRLLDSKSEPLQEDRSLESQLIKSTSPQLALGAGDVPSPNVTETQQSAPLPPVLCSSERKSTRIKRPDRQMYVPRPKRLSAKDETFLSAEGIDKSDSQPRAKVFIREKQSHSHIKVRKKSDGEDGVERPDTGLPTSAEALEKQVEERAGEISQVSAAIIDLSSESASAEPSFSSLDGSILETSQLNESSEAFDSSFQTCPEASFSSENSLAIVGDSCDNVLSEEPSGDCDVRLDKFNSETSQSPVSNVESASSSPKLIPVELDSTNGRCGSRENNSEISNARLVVQDTDTPNSSLVSFSSDSGSLANLNESTDSTSARVMGFLDISSESDKDSPVRLGIRERALAKSPEAVADDWELLLNENGQLFDPSLLKELEEAVGKVNISRPSCDYKDFQTVEERTSDGESIIEIYGFSSELRTHDLMNIFSPLCGNNFQIAWVDDTHALGVFPSPIMADELLSTELPFVRTRPLSEGIPESRFKARKLILPPLTRPKTCPALARRLVTGALGLRLPTSKLEREAERKVLKEARDKKRQEAKIRKDIWEGN